eukprot:972948_1
MAAEKKEMEVLKNDVGSYLKVLDKKRLVAIKKDYDKMYAAIYSKAPEKRECSKIDRMIKLPKDKLKKGAIVILKQELEKINMKGSTIDKLAKELQNKIDLMDVIGITVDFSNHFENKLSYDWGGKTHVGLAVIGIAPVKDKKDMVNFVSVAHYEDWQEYKNIRLNKKSSVWKDKVLYNFLLHQLWEHVQLKLGYDQE